MWEVRKAGLNIMMSMKGDGKPVSFIEDCAVPLEHLADYTQRLTDVFTKHGTRGTWYAHASVGTLHVRPILDMRREGAAKMRAIAEEASAIVREYKGAFSGEHGDGLVRSEWVAWQFGPRLTKAFEAVKDLFDPAGILNPGKIVRPSRMDDRSLFRFKPGYARRRLQAGARLVGLERPDRSSHGGGVRTGQRRRPDRWLRQGRRDVQQQRPLPEVRRRHDVPFLPRDARRGASDARPRQHAAAGAVGPARPGALTSDAVAEAMDLCVSCKGCKRDCPTGVDMARMKIEVKSARRMRKGLSLRDRLIGNLPEIAP